MTEQEKKDVIKMRENGASFTSIATAVQRQLQRTGALHVFRVANQFVADRLGKHVRYRRPLSRRQYFIRSCRDERPELQR